MRRPVPAAAAHRRAHDERHRHLVVVHLAELRDPVDDLVEAERDEVAEHDLEDRPLAPQRHPGGDAEERRLADRGREDAVRVRVAEALRDLERPAVRVEDVLAEEDDVVALGEDRVQRLVEDLDAALPLRRGAHAATPGVAAGAASAASTVSASRSSQRSSIALRSSSASRAPATSSGSRVRRSSISAGSRWSSDFECGLKRYVLRTRKKGAPVSRIRATARPAASWIDLDVGRVELVRLDTERRAARRDRARQLELDRRGLRVVVVLDDEQHRQLPERRDVQRLVGHALAERAVAEEDRRDGAGPFPLLRERDPGRDRDDAPEDAVRVEVALAQVLAAALAAAHARRLAHHLAEQPERVVGEREVVPVAAVVGEDRVDVGIEVVDHADRVRLLPDVRVRRPDELPEREEVEERLLEAADEEHPLVEGRELGHLAGSRGRRAASRRSPPPPP